MIPLTVNSQGQFSKRLQDRVTKWKGATAAARLTVPPDLKWWYWNEFGTATKYSPISAAGLFTVQPAPGVVKSGGYEIDPVTGEALRFPQGGKIVYRDQVDHPGIKPSRSVTKSIQDIQERTKRIVAESFQHGAADNPLEFSTAIVKSVQGAKEVIATHMDNDLHRRDLEPERGRLGGKTAAADFYDRSTVVDLSTSKG